MAGLIHSFEVNSLGKKQLFVSPPVVTETNDKSDRYVDLKGESRKIPILVECTAVLA